MFDLNKLSANRTKHMQLAEPECPWDLRYFVYNASWNYTIDECVADL